MDEEYAEYRCSACKKAIKNQVIKCKSCVRLFYHPGCVNKHKIYNVNQELVACPGPFEKIIVESDKEADMKKSSTATGSSRDRLGSTGSIGSCSGSRRLDVSGSLNIDGKIDWIIKTIKEIKNETTCKNEIKMIIKEVVREELGNMKQELNELRNMIQGRADTITGGRSYSETVKEKKKENVIIIKPKEQQESEATKNIVKEKIDIKKLPIGISKLRKGGKGTVILGCESEKEIKELKSTVQSKLGERYQVVEPRITEPKLKILNVEEDEIKLEEEDIIELLIKQNQLEKEREGFHMEIIKKIMKDKKNDNKNVSRGRRSEGALILAADEITHNWILKNGKVNIGWKKCYVTNYINVKRCFNCWGFYHIAKNCTRPVTCHGCAGDHKENECKAGKKKCVNCMYKNRTYNLKINDEHDALSWKCPTFKRILEEEKKRVGWEKEE